MKPLSETNPYIRDLKKRDDAIKRSVIESSAFEGARDLSKAHFSTDKLRSKDVAKKSVSKS